MLHQYLHIGQVSRRVARRQDEALINCLARRASIGTAGESHVKSHIDLLELYDMAADPG